MRFLLVLIVVTTVAGAERQVPAPDLRPADLDEIKKIAAKEIERRANARAGDRQERGRGLRSIRQDQGNPVGAMKAGGTEGASGAHDLVRQFIVGQFTAVRSLDCRRIAAAQIAERQNLVVKHRRCGQIGPVSHKGPACIGASAPGVGGFTISRTLIYQCR